MQGRTSQESVAALLEQLATAVQPKPPADHINHTAAIAVLWTWLSAHLQDLGSLRDSTPVIKERARQLPAFTTFDVAESRRIEDAPLEGAAELLARIARDRQPRGAATLAERTTGFDGADVVVIWKSPMIAIRVGGGVDSDGEGVPPAAMEHPSLVALAPRVSVCDYVVGNIALEPCVPKGHEWTAICNRVEAALSEPVEAADGQAEELDFEVHMDPMEHHGLTGWLPSDDHVVGWFDESAVNPGDAERALAAITTSVHAAQTSSTGLSFLVLPELAVTTALRDALTTSLLECEDGPSLTFVGLFHRAVDDSGIDPVLLGSATPAGHVNEALALGPDGGVLWTHQKMTRAQGEGEPAITEDNVVGRSLTIVPGPLGVMTMAICLDTFAEAPRDRLEASGADLIFVPSLSPRDLRHRTSLEHLTQPTWSCAFVCNRGMLAEDEDERAAQLADPQGLWNDDKNRSFWAIQRQPVHVPPPWRPVTHPSFVFRLAEWAKNGLFSDHRPASLKSESSMLDNPDQDTSER